MKYNTIRYSVVIIVLVMLTAFAKTTFGCRYNVRETGFVYLAQKPYQLKVFYSDRENRNDIETIQQLAKNYFSGSNIEMVYLNVNSENSSNELLLMQKNESFSLPWVLLKSADGQIMKFSLKEKGISLEKSAGKVFRNISFSKERDELIQKCINNYGVVLILEGTDSEANEKATEMAQLAINHVESKMSLMPKRIKAPPVIVSFKNNRNDSILNWSLGVANKTFEKPKVFVIYGRGRWIGPVLENEMISKKHLSELLIIVGADCECGIDREWMRGTMIPVKWGKKYRNKVVENLGFDPENPLIKKEVRHILRMGEIFGRIPQNDTIITGFENYIEQSEPIPTNLKPEESTVGRNTFFAFSSVFIIIMVLLVIVLKKRKS